MSEKLKMNTGDVIKENINYIAQRFPNALKDVEVDGRIVKQIDFDILKQELSDILIDDKQERYQMTWPDKKKSILLANSRINGTLRPIKNKSVNFDDSKNLYIEGDNLEVLKLLRETYLNKVRLIYIDPPYNTGNDFIYNDEFFKSAEEYLKSSGQIDEYNNRVFANPESSGRYHTDWLNMMYPRLKVAKDLMRQDGVIFISIGEAEVANLIKICNEIFGEKNFLGCCGRISKKANNQGQFWAPNFDYLVSYAKSITECESFFGGMNITNYKYIEEEGPRKGERYELVRLYMTSLDPLRGCVNQRYFIEAPDGTLLIPPGEIFPEELKDGAMIPPSSGKDKIWRWSRDSYLANKDKLVIKQVSSSNLVNEKGEKVFWNVFTKTYLNDVISKQTSCPNNFLEDFINQQASHELKKLGIPFTFAKPTSLIKHLCSISRLNENDIVLDFFSGSGTTGDAVMQFNAENNTKLKFILVQLPENIDESDDAYKDGYRTICDIGEERLRRAGKKVKDESGLLESGLDNGFRVLSFDSSNMNNVFYHPKETSQSLLGSLVDNVKPDRTPLDLLFQIMLELGIELSAKIEERKIAGKNCFIVNENDIVACFDSEVNEEVIKELAKIKPIYAVFRDGVFESDAANINCEQIFKSISPSTTIKVL